MIKQYQKRGETQYKFSTENLPEALARKVSGLVNVLNQSIIDMKQLRAFLGQGIPDEAPLIRQYAWKIILGYLPRQKIKWSQQIAKQQSIYNSFVDQFLNEQKYHNFPLLMSKQHPEWQKYQEDFYLWQQIQKDTCRTQSQLSFFSTEVAQTLIPFFTSTRKQKYKMINGDDLLTINNLMENKEQQRLTYRYDYMTRILFIFAKLNPKAQYVQGMNQILAPIFYLVNSGKKGNHKPDEAACFFMFNNAMTDLIQLHIKDFDKKQNGIHAKMQDISKMLLAVEPSIWYKFQVNKIDPFYYCFRWLTLLFSQEFQLFETLRVWESIFSYDDRSTYTNYFALAMIISTKSVILYLDYSQILGYLKQISQHINVQETILLANELYHEYKHIDLTTLANKNNKKLEKNEKEVKKRNKLVNFFKKLI